MSKEFYNMCIEKAKKDGAKNPDLDAQCLQCGRRIASHALREFVRCEKAYQKHTYAP